jgi:hypothetical protein
MSDRLREGLQLPLHYMKKSYSYQHLCLQNTGRMVLLADEAASGSCSKELRRSVYNDRKQVNLPSAESQRLIFLQTVAVHSGRLVACDQNQIEVRG